MAETGRLTAPAAPFANPVTLVRIAIIAGVLVMWEAVAASGLLFRDVVPSLLVIGRADRPSCSPTRPYYWHLGVTAARIGIGLLIGWRSGLAVGILLGSNKLLSRAFEALSLLISARPEDHLLSP
jgi:ABC-type nitrate/sulfonate/bicarbonate transport system permease component